MTEDESCSELLLDNQLCFALYSTSLMMTKTYKPLLKALDLTYPQYLAMLVLWEEDGMTVSQLSKRLLTDPGSVTPILKRLEVDGLLTRQRRKEDDGSLNCSSPPEERRFRTRPERFPVASLMPAARRCQTSWN